MVNADSRRRDTAASSAPPLSMGLRDSGQPRDGAGLAPSARRLFRRLLSSVVVLLAVRLPERFRGGCAFGADAACDSGSPDSPARRWP